MKKRYTDKSGNRRDLTDKQIKFCRCVVEGKTLIESYLEAGYRSESRKASQNKASKLFAEDHIQDYIKELRAESASLSIWTREDTLIKLKTLAEDAIKASRPMMLDKDGQPVLDEDGQPVRGYDPPSAAIAIKAIQQAATMCGFNAPQEVEQKVVVEIPPQLTEWAR